MPRIAVSKPICPSNSRVDMECEIDHYRREFLSYYKGVPPSSKTFPGCNPLSLSRKGMSDLERGGYIVSLKTDGVRYALFLTCRKEDPSSAVALMIDRAWNMYEVDVVATDSFFIRRTILEGELVWKQPEERQLLYLVFDAILVEGRQLLLLPFEKRIEEATVRTFLSEELSMQSWKEEEVDARCVEMNTIVIVHYDPPISMRPKRFVVRRFAKKLWEERGDTDHRVDGLILHRGGSKYTYGTAKDGSVLKWKEHSTIDLKGMGKELSMVEGPLPTHIHGRKIVIMESKICAESSEDVLEYLVSVTDLTVHLFPLRNRRDKTTANGNKVVVATISDVMEKIGVDEISETHVHC